MPIHQLRTLVREDEEGLLLQNLLQKRWSFSRSMLRRLKRDGLVRVNGRPAFHTSRVRAGDVVEVTLPVKETPDLEPEEIRLDIVYEDEWIAVPNKPAGMVVHPTMSHTRGTLANALAAHWQARREAARFHAVQRLDRETSGLMLVAKHSYVHQQATRQLQQGQLRRKYLALVEGRVYPTEGVIDAPIQRVPDSIMLRRVHPDGKRAITRYRLLRQSAEASLLELELLTGRTHQIRVHLAHLGHPLMGDELYGGSKRRIRRHALHAHWLRFEHPISGEPIRLQAALPRDMQRLMQDLGL